MTMLQRNVAMAILSTLLVSFSTAFTPVAPPPLTVAAPAESAQLPSLVTSSSNLPAQSELLQRASFSTINLAAAAPTSVVAISDINYDGKVATTEADEYVVVTNASKGPIDVSGYYIYVATTGTQGPTFTFPKDSILKPGQTIRIYTNEIHKESGGYSFGSGKAIWNNRGGVAVLKDMKGTKLGEFKYTPKA